MEENNLIDSDGISLFEQNGIIGIDSVTLSNKNVIVGENGSGKTRFLKTIEQIYKIKKTDNELLLTLYFPNVRSVVSPAAKVANQSNDTNDTSFYIFDLLKANDVADNSDFLKIIEEAQDSCKFIITLFNFTRIGTPKENKKAQEIIEAFNSKFRKLSNREFYENEGMVWVRKFSGAEIVRTVPIDSAFLPEEISPGELMLFYFSILLSYLEVIQYRKLILIIDEPEQHLHPQKQIELINLLNNSPVVSQIWMATHSVFLIPYFSFDQVILLDNGQVVPRNSNLYSNTVEKLIGCDNLDALEFATSLDVWQYNHFILECFFEANVILNAKKGDEQVVNVINLIRSVLNIRPIKVLDFGAGKTRFWECFKMEFPDTETRKRLIRYRAFEPNQDKNFKYDQAIPVYQDLDDVYRKADKNNLVLMLNVLHEIPVVEWVDVFKNISNLLLNDGFLILVETKMLSVGERPNDANGFLLLSEPEVKILFENALKIVNKNSDKSNLWVIPRIDLTTINLKKVYQSISSLHKRTEIILRKEFANKLQKAGAASIKYEKIRSYAFLSQQYINSKFALEILEVQIKNPTRNPSPPRIQTPQSP